MFFLINLMVKLLKEIDKKDLNILTFNKLNVWLFDNLAYFHDCTDSSEYVIVIVHFFIHFNFVC